ncbi:tyrosyl-DNA phosphodiesterase [Aureococcus anophagefferens]|nr:tyrosyl-DNA phosphodiesterase [Aureococcus anophagefferens]
MWVCGTCTLLNESDSFLQCSACAALRPAKRKALNNDQGVSKRQAIDLCDSDDEGGDAADKRAAAATQLATQRDEALARSLHAAEVTPDGDEKSLALARRLAAEDAPSVGADLAMAQAMDLGDKLSVARDFERDRQIAIEEQEKERHAQALAPPRRI